MKITIAYLAEEKVEAATIVAVLRRLHPDIKVRKSDTHKPFLHIYLTTTKTGKRCNSNENG